MKGGEIQGKRKAGKLRGKVERISTKKWTRGKMKEERKGKKEKKKKRENKKERGRKRKILGSYRRE